MKRSKSSKRPNMNEAVPAMLRGAAALITDGPWAAPEGMGAVTLVPAHVWVESFIRLLVLVEVDDGLARSRLRVEEELALLDAPHDPDRAVHATNCLVVRRALDGDAGTFVGLVEFIIAGVQLTPEEAATAKTPQLPLW